MSVVTSSAAPIPEKDLPLSYARTLSWLSFVVILLTSLGLSFFISNSARQTLLTRQEDFAHLLAQNLNHQIYQRFALPTLLAYGRIALRQNTIRQVKNEGAGRWEVIKAEEAGEPTPEVHVRENLPGDYEPVPLEQVLENMSQLGYSLVSREQGGPEDDWRERCIWEDSQTETQTVFYWADSMADLESFWPEVVPHAFWLDGQYTSSPMGMSYGYDADLATGEVWGRYFSGEYTGEDGAAFEFGFTYNARYTWPDWYSVDLTGQEYQEQYETQDGAVVSIEIIPSVTGKSVFYTAISTEHTICTLHGTQMELEEIRDILDHLELSQLLTYQPEPTE